MNLGMHGWVPVVDGIYDVFRYFDAIQYAVFTAGRKRMPDRG